MLYTLALNLFVMLLKNQPPIHRRAISLTPLIDVVFILLLFFMLSSTFTQWRHIDVSATTASVTETKPIRQLTLLSEEGMYELEGQRYLMADIERMRNLVAAKTDAIYVINVEAGLRTQSMISLLDQLKKAGAETVTLTGVN